jgi:putative transposase
LTRSYQTKGHCRQQKLSGEEWVLPESFTLEVEDLAQALRAGVYAVGVKAAVLIAQQMLAAELEAIAGPKGKHRKDRQVTRHGSQDGFIVVGGRKVKIRRPRARTKDGREVALKNYKRLQDDTVLDELSFERMLYGVATRHYGKVEAALPEDIETYGTSKSAVSERFARATGRLLERFLSRRLDELKVPVVFVDAIFLGPHANLVALGVDQEGQKHVLGMREGATENAAVCQGLFEDLRARGLDTRQGVLFVVDGSKAIAAAVRSVFGEEALIQRCLVHKRRNILEHLPERERGWVSQKLAVAFAKDDVNEARADLVALAKELDVKHPGAARSLREGLEETLTVQKLGITCLLRRSLRTTNAVEALHGLMRSRVRRVSRFVNGGQALRWAATAALVAEGGLYRMAGYQQLPVLVEALLAYVQLLKEVRERAS